VSIVLTVLQSVLLLLSGIGYLQQKRFLGRTLGIVYALLAIGFAVLAAMAMPEEIGGGFALGTIVGLVYPVLTLLLLNVTFKHDFIR
jgi:NADH:ubiquinone oxidoreductase subunit 6 (subunit J)